MRDLALPRGLLSAAAGRLALVAAALSLSLWIQAACGQMPSNSNYDTNEDWWVGEDRLGA